VALVPCRNCGAKISEKALACPKCGSKDPHKEVAVSCSECGTELPVHHNGSCPECGNPDIPLSQSNECIVAQVTPSVQVEIPERVSSNSLGHLSASLQERGANNSRATPETPLTRLSSQPEKARVRQRPQEQYRSTPSPSVRAAYRVQNQGWNYALIAFGIIGTIVGALILWSAIVVGDFAVVVNSFLQLFCGLFIWISLRRRSKLLDLGDIIIGWILSSAGMIYGFLLLYDGFRPRNIDPWSMPGFSIMGWFGAFLVTSSILVGALVKRLPKAQSGRPTNGLKRTPDGAA
jgi:Zn finger protein HypA/HybF involved in hydrogenase expression